MEKMKQNKNTSAFIMVASATLVVVFLFCSLTIPSFAESTNNVSFTEYNCSDYSSKTNLFRIGYDTSNVNSYCYIYFNSGNNFYPYGITISDNVYRWGFFLDSSTSATYTTLTAGNPSGWSDSDSRFNGISSSNSYSSGNALYGSDVSYITGPSNRYVGGFTDNVPIFSSFDDACTSFAEYLNQSSVSAQQITYQIPAGYVAFFDIHGLSNIQGSVLASSGIPLTPSEWASTNILYGYSSSIPSSFSLPLSGSTSFSWRTGKTNIYGKSQSWSWLGTFAGGSNYLFVSNPTYSNVMGVQSNGSSMILDNPSATNSYVTVYLSEAYSVKLVSLSALITYDPANGNYGGVDDGSGDSSYSVEYDPDTGTWVTTNDQTGTPTGVEGIPVGGDNSIDIPSEFSTITAWLENIANTIGAFFRGAIGAVSTLVSSGAAFINQLVSLYSWLPAPVYAVLSSALILVITIGVIKVFI